MSWEDDCKHYDDCDNCEFFKDQINSLKNDIAKLTDRLTSPPVMIDSSDSSVSAKLREQQMEINRLRGELEALGIS